MCTVYIIALFSFSTRVQLKEDFIQDRLFPRATINTAVWMAAIDMAREALDKKKDFNDLT